MEIGQRMTTEDFEKLKATLDQKEKEYARNEGNLESLMKDLQNKFGVSSLKEATALLEKKEAELETAEKELAVLSVKIEAIVKEHP